MSGGKAQLQCVFAGREEKMRVFYYPIAAFTQTVFFLFVSVVLVKMALHRLISSSCSLAESLSSAVVVRLQSGLSLSFPLSVFSIMLFVMVKTDESGPGQRVIIDSVNHVRAGVHVTNILQFNPQTKQDRTRQARPFSSKRA